jgi:hypothetical protein
VSIGDCDRPVGAPAFDNETGRALAVAMSDALTWNTLVSKQYVRVLEANNRVDRQLDLYLFAISVRGVLRAADLARAIAQDAGMRQRVSKIDRAKGRFDSTIPDSKQVRDVLEHFDAYRRGKGDLQNDRKMDEYVEWVEQHEGEITLVLGGTYRLPLNLTKAASDALADAVVDATLPSSVK